MSDAFYDPRPLQRRRRQTDDGRTDGRVSPKTRIAGNNQQQKQKQQFSIGCWRVVAVAFWKEEEEEKREENSSLAPSCLEWLYVERLAVLPTH